MSTRNTGKALDYAGLIGEGRPELAACCGLCLPLSERMTTLTPLDRAVDSSTAVPVLPRFEKQKHLAISFRCGRLANRLILFANFVALAEEHGHDLTNYTFHSYSEFFEGTQQNFHCRYPRPRRRSLFDVTRISGFLRLTRIAHHIARYSALLNERYPLFGSRVATVHEFDEPNFTVLESPEYQDAIRPARFVFVYGWMLRSPALVKKHADKIRSYFRPVAEFTAAAAGALTPLRAKGDIVIGVHVRQRDYRHWQGGRFFFEAARYAQWMRDLETQLPGRKVVFLVCSDEPRNADEFAGLTVGFGTSSPVGDLCALSQCDFIMGPQSTFSQWASFYGGKPLLHLRSADHAVRLEDFRVCYLDWPC